MSQIQFAMVESSGHFWRNAAENGMKNNKSRLMAAFFI
jgi:hypothetical protein